jgi:hypothetical protein
MNRVLLACLALLQIAPISAQDLESLKARADAITRQGGQIASRRLRREMQERMEAAKLAAKQGDLERADALLREMETELTQLTQADPNWQALLEMDGPLNTNYQAGAGFFPGGSDPDPAPPVITRNGLPVITTDAAGKTFPNQRTDAMTFDRNSKPLTDLARSTAEILGRRVPLKFHRPAPGFEAGLETGVDKVQFVVNQLFTADGHDVLATWALPPHWSPDRTYVTLIGVPGMSHTNNSKLFAEPSQSFLKTWLTAVTESRNAGVIFVHFNCGGRSAMGLHPGFEQVLDAALLWGSFWGVFGVRLDAR